MSGAEIKSLIHNSGVKCWQVAAELGMNDGNFSRRLRKPFSEAETAEIKSIIERIIEKKQRLNHNRKENAHNDYYSTERR